MDNYARLVVELPSELKELFRQACKNDLTDMSTKTRQLILMYANNWASDYVERNRTKEKPD